MSVVVGADYSTRYVDFVLLDEDTLQARWRRYELHGHDAFERARSVRARIPGRAEWDDVLAFGIEEPPYVKGNPATLRDLARVQGAVLQSLPHDRLVKPWTPSEWRKAVGLPGNATKDEVRARSIELWPLTEPWSGQPLPQDAHDAHLVALATLRALERQEAA